MQQQVADVVSSWWFFVTNAIVCNVVDFSDLLNCMYFSDITE